MYTFTTEYATPGGNDMFFSCGIGEYCENNINQAIKVFPAVDYAPTPDDTDAPSGAPVDVVTPPPIDAPTFAPANIVTPTLTQDKVPGETDAPTVTPTDAAATTCSINIGFLGIVAISFSNLSFYSQCILI
jgi:hypothetical protein